MKTISLRAVKAQLSAIIEAAEKGETTIVTKFGEPAAMIVPFKEERQEEGADRPDRPSFGKALLSLPHNLDF
jgi:prevent-host-death family protein